MTLQQLKYIVEIVNRGSMREAASRLYVSQPSLSAAVKELETELGFDIFIRSNKGISLSMQGSEFLGYARQVLEQAELLENRFLGKKPARRIFSVSAQHYAFAVNAFVSLIREYDATEYEFAIRETKTHEIVEDVKTLRSEIGILYLNDFNEQVIRKLLRENHLEFHPLFEASPHVFLGSNNPLAQKEKVSLDDLAPYPCLTFDQGIHNSFYYSEEILSTVSRPKNIQVSDRATLFNLLVGLKGYTISTGIISSDLNGENIVSIPLDSREKIRIGCITQKSMQLSPIGRRYIELLKEYINETSL